MENKNVKTHSTKSSPWIECESKSRPGKKYLFNTATGERKWLETATLPEKPSQTFKSPANDRLKRLQRDLQKAKPLKKKINEKDKLQKVQTILKKSVAIGGTLPVVSPKERLKILQTKAIEEKLKNKTQETLRTKSKVPSLAEPRKRNAEREELLKRKAEKRPAPESKTVKERASLNITQKSQKYSPKKLKNDCTAKESVTYRIPKIENSKKDSQNIAKKCLLQNEKTPSPQKTETNGPELKFLTEIPNNNCSSLKRLKCSANKRLERLRDSLQTENKLDNSNIEYEAMDWEPIEEPSTSCSTFGYPDSQNNNVLEEPTDMEVDENLMLVAAAEEKQNIKNLREKWRKNFIYIVLDTNVFIMHLPFIEKLKTTKIINVPGIVLYIPYSVLQELDKLKLRENVKASAVRAIRFLNKMFEEKNEIIQAQSALEERKHIIEVESADDSILNCCLQVQAHIPNVILFTEDVNLRNKAICNNINVSTKSDLFEKLL